MSNAVRTNDGEEDTGLTNFWKELAQVAPKKVDGESWNWTIRLKQSCFLHKTDLGRVLFVRHVYKQLWDKFTAPDNPRRCDGIMWTPGTGKSFFLLYALWRIASDKKPTSVVFQDTDGQRIFFDGNSRKAFVGSDFRAQLSKDENFYLIDGARDTSLPTLVNARSYLATSPSNSVYRRFIKDHKLRALRVTPTWTLKEMQKLAEAHNLFREKRVNKERRKELVAEFQAMLGGVPRHLVVACESFVRDELIGQEWKSYAEVIFKQELDWCNIDACLNAMQRGSGVESEVSHALFLMHPRKDDDRRFTLEMASKFTRKLFIDRARLLGEERLRRFLAQTHALGGSFPSIRGVLFEGYAMSRLSRGGDFAVQQLDETGLGVRSKLKVAPTTEKLFSKTSEIDPDETSTLWVPTSSTFPAIDCFSSHDRLYQMTVSHKGHDLTLKCLRDLKKKYGADKTLHVYFVVPNHDYDKSFKKRQPVMTQDKKKTKQNPKHKQWVLVVPVDELVEEKDGG
eukprot:TRINITY_DN69602_c0_g1_i1.p1 TRINITY_DN69602_c0_g1~~TRINITY_DN69602_c0_g1_i1.p1  ORF type:complete len:510 (-),score=134.44 TRINITY_DN69602_c0_g1_i1:190-1719(-)